MFKFTHIYRQLSQYSLRLISKKLISTAGNSLPVSSLTSSPSKAGRRGFISLRGSPTPSGLINMKQRDGPLKLLPKRSYTTTCNESAQINTETCINSTQSRAHIIPTIDLMFPLLTGEELKAFDSSVYE